MPADRKWFTRLVVASAVIEALESLHPSFPDIDADRRRELDAARAELISEDQSAKSRTRPTRPTR